MESAYWESRYQTGDTQWEKGAASPGLEDFLTAHPELPRGSVAVPGCGTGHDARAWAKAGFDAWGFDFAPSAIALCEERTRAAGLKAHFHQRNFLTESPPQPFDWLFEHTLFCAINPQQRDEYVAAIQRWLKPGGQFLAVHYLIPDKDGPPFGSTREEIERRFAPHFEKLADWVPRSYPNRTGLEWMVWWRRRSG
jgi:SAM-dependent methyltransferase